MLAAMERIQADGADVINMSIGDAFNTWAGVADGRCRGCARRRRHRGRRVDRQQRRAGHLLGRRTGVGDKVIGVASFDNTDIAAHLRSRCRLTGTRSRTRPGNRSADRADVRHVSRCPRVGTQRPRRTLGCDAARYGRSLTGTVALIQTRDVYVLHQVATTRRPPARRRRHLQQPAAVQGFITVDPNARATRRSADHDPRGQHLRDRRQPHRRPSRRAGHDDLDGGYGAVPNPTTGGLDLVVQLLRHRGRADA